MGLRTPVHSVPLAPAFTWSFHDHSDAVLNSQYGRFRLLLSFATRPRASWPHDIRASIARSIDREPVLEDRSDRLHDRHLDAAFSRQCAGDHHGRDPLDQRGAGTPLTRAQQRQKGKELRDCGLEACEDRSPRPDRPISVSGRAPRRFTRRGEARTPAPPALPTRSPEPAAGKCRRRWPARS